MDEFEYFEDEFTEFLKNRNSNERTIYGRLQRVRSFFNNYGSLNEETYNEYYEYLNDNCKPSTVNSSIISLNLYVKFLEQKYNITLEKMCAKTVKIKKVQFLEDIATIDEYLFFMNKAKVRNKDKLYIICKIMATTGMRIHETLQIRREHIELGFIDFIGKGGKERRCYFTPTTQKEVLELLDKHCVIDKQSYVVSSNWNGKQLSWKDVNVINKSMRNFAENECELPKGLFHPHMFRHFFAKNFIKKYQNIALLADLLGHSNLETTRIYLKYTSREQREVVNEVVTW